jgi:7,8-dihydropterin-6-yl-methyl-4-(beta-D-ribofuranosyl)aminobenzene 5'-phosphate synthase
MNLLSSDMTLRLDIVCENTVGRPISACGEHGFACLVKNSSGTWLFDTGSGETLLANLEALQLDAHQIDGVILSHGHYDHCGGLLPLLRKIGPRPVYAHPHIFRERFWQGQHEERPIGVPYSRAALEAAGADFKLCDKFMTLSPGLFFSGAIPRLAPFEVGDPHLVRPAGNDGSWTADELYDDSALAMETSKGLIVLLGCAHAGLVNTLEYFLYRLGNPRIHTIVGGTHLGPADDEQFLATVDYLARLDFDRLGVSHCTGQLRSAQLHTRFPNKVFFANVGTSVKID